MIRRCFSRPAILVLLFGIYLAMAGRSVAQHSGEPVLQAKTHDVGNVWLTITNSAYIGGDYVRPSCRYPAGSAREYLFYGAFWVGALVEDDTLVSAGVSGWLSQVSRLLPGSDPGDTILEQQVVSDQDFIAISTDTATAFQPPGSTPLGIQLVQRSYAWADTTYYDFVIFDCSLRNIGENNLEDTYVGILIDADCGKAGDQYGPRRGEDDVTGLMWATYWVDSNAIPWARDYDWDDGKTPGAIGLELLGLPNSAHSIAYNWWATYDTLLYPGLWGPTDPTNPRDVPYPETRQDYYVLMGNGYFDPDQMDPINAPCNVPADQRFLFSFGPFDLNPGDTTNFAFALVCGLGFSELQFHARRAKLLYEWGYVPRDTATPPGIAGIELSQNLPNPFAKMTTIYFTLPGVPGRIQDARHATLFVYDASGRRIRTLTDWPKSPGLHWVYWRGEDDSGNRAGSGVYFYRLQLGELSATRRMIFVRR